MNTNKPSWIKIVRSNLSSYERRVCAFDSFTSSNVAAKFLLPRLSAEEVEVFICLYLNNSNKLISAAEIARGGLTGCTLDVRSIFRPAMILNASGLILAHNHPSGNNNPSNEDILFTRNVMEASKILGVTILDHIIISAKDKYFSFADNNLIIRSF